MKSEKGISAIILLVVIIIVLICMFAFMNISNNNTTEDVNANSTSSTNTNVNTTTKNTSKIIGSWQTGVFIYTFNEDGTATLSGNGINTQNFTYEIKGNNLSLTNTETNASIELEYSIDDDTLYIGSESYTKVQ